MKIYTKTGDGGETGLFGGGRVSKDSLRIEAYGTIDELNSVLGMLQSQTADAKVNEIVNSLQNNLFTIGADLATPISAGNAEKSISRLQNDAVLEIEQYIDLLESGLEPLKSFILPGGSKAAGICHFARTVCRRAERRIVALTQHEEINPEIVKFVNRVSDLLFVLARHLNKLDSKPDIIWKSSRG